MGSRHDVFFGETFSSHEEQIPLNPLQVKLIEEDSMKHGYSVLLVVMGMLCFFLALAEYPALLYYSVLCGRYDGSSALPGIVIISCRLSLRLFIFLTLSGLLLKRYQRIDLGGISLGMTWVILLEEMSILAGMVGYFASDSEGEKYFMLTMYLSFALCLSFLWRLRRAPETLKRRYSPFAYCLYIAAILNCSFYLGIIGLPLRCIAMALLGIVFLKEAKTVLVPASLR